VFGFYDAVFLLFLFYFKKQPWLKLGLRQWATVQTHVCVVLSLHDLMMLCCSSLMTKHYRICLPNLWNCVNFLVLYCIQSLMLSRRTCSQVLLLSARKVTVCTWAYLALDWWWTQCKTSSRVFVHIVCRYLVSAIKRMKITILWASLWTKDLKNLVQSGFLSLVWAMMMPSKKWLLCFSSNLLCGFKS